MLLKLLPATPCAFCSPVKMLACRMNSFPVRSLYYGTDIVQPVMMLSMPTEMKVPARPSVTLYIQASYLSRCDDSIDAARR